MAQQNDDLKDDLTDEFKDDDEELWGEWTENPEEESATTEERNSDDFYGNSDEE